MARFVFYGIESCATAAALLALRSYFFYFFFLLQVLIFIVLRRARGWFKKIFEAYKNSAALNV